MYSYHEVGNRTVMVAVWLQVEISVNSRLCFLGEGVKFKYISGRSEFDAFFILCGFG